MQVLLSIWRGLFAEDGLAPSGGEGWAPPRAYDDGYFVITPCFMLIVCTKLWQRNALAALIVRQRNALVLNLGARVSQKHDTKHNS